jgi:uncharacterized protein
VKPTVVDGYEIDPVAQFNTPELTFEWLDHVMRGGSKPALLVDRINYEVMGANEWRHAPSIEKMSPYSAQLYLTTAKSGERYRLSERRPQLAELDQTIDFSDRTSSTNLYPPGVLLSQLEPSAALAFVSDPIDDVVTIAGRMTGVLHAIIDKKDMDFSLALYELMPNGRGLSLSYYLGRASYAHDMAIRTLLTPGRRTAIPVLRTPLIGRIPLHKSTMALART